MCSWPLQLYQIFFIKNLFILYISMLIIIHKMLNGTDAIASSTLLKNTRNSNNYNMWNHWIRNKVSVIYKVEDRYNCTSIPRGVIWAGKKHQEKAQLDCYYTLNHPQPQSKEKHTLKKTKNTGFVNSYTPKDNSIPKHNIIVLGSPTDASRRILLQSFKIPHQSLPSRSRHLHLLYPNQVQFKQ